MDDSYTLNLRFSSIRYLSRDISLFELSSPHLSVLPPVEPGAHIALLLEEGMVREYSLVHAGEQLTKYEIGVKRMVEGRGGSKFLHDRVKVGDMVRVRMPANNFALDQTARSSIFFAGGIGITPIVSMVERLAQIGRPAKLYYAVRDRQDAAFLDDLALLCELHLHVDTENDGVFDIRTVIEAAPADAHLYCCGPLPMLQAFETVTAQWPDRLVHLEYFAPGEEAATTGGFEVVLKQSGTTVKVTPGKTILRAIQEAGVSLPFSCEKGICGACETRVLEGVPDHRDSFLSNSEKDGNKAMMVCCSGSKTPRLVLDI